MKLEEALHNNRHKIVDKWVAYTLSTYQSSGFFIKEKDAFANPVGNVVRTSLQELFRLLRAGDDPARFKDPLRQLMHLRCVQEFTPSQAVAPLNSVKHITRDVLEADKETKGLPPELYDFEFAVDLAVLAAFDLYTECREKIYRIRISELKTGRAILTDNACASKALKNIQEKKGNQ